MHIAQCTNKYITGVKTRNQFYSLKTQFMIQAEGFVSSGGE